MSALRLFVLGSATAGIVFWAGALVQWWLIHDSGRTGMDVLGTALATAVAIVLALPTFILGSLNRLLWVGALLGAAVLVVVSDTLWPWVPW